MIGYILIGCLVLLIILLCLPSKDVLVHNVYTDDDEKPESSKSDDSRKSNNLNKK
jgi:hypothetical protein